MIVWAALIRSMSSLCRQAHSPLDWQALDCHTAQAAASCCLTGAVADLPDGRCCFTGHVHGPDMCLRARQNHSHSHLGDLHVVVHVLEGHGHGLKGQNHTPACDLSPACRARGQLVSMTTSHAHAYTSVYHCLPTDGSWPTDKCLCRHTTPESSAPRR